MKKNVAPLLFGLVLVILGLGFLGATFLGWSFNIFFDGWWTLFIIIPTLASIVTNGPSTGNVVGCTVGVLLLLRAQDIIKQWSHFAVCLVGLVIIAIGISIILGFFGKGRPGYYGGGQSYSGPPPRSGEPNQGGGPPPPGSPGYNATQGAAPGQAGYNAGYQSAPGQADYNNGWQYASPPPNSGYWSQDASDFPSFTGILSGTTARCVSRDLQGVRASAILGGIDLNLRDAIITHDITIYLTAIMGGIDVYAPRNVRIAFQKTDILGGTDCKAYTLGENSGAPVCTFVCTSIMGGIDIM